MRESLPDMVLLDWFPVLPCYEYIINVTKVEGPFVAVHNFSSSLDTDVEVVKT